MELRIGDTIQTLKTGDTIKTSEGTFLVFSAEEFELFDDQGEKVNIILVDVEKGEMEGHDARLDDLWMYYDIKEVIPNIKSNERKIKQNDKVIENTGIEGIIADIQYEFDRYQFQHISGWRYGINNITKVG